MDFNYEEIMSELRIFSRQYSQCHHIFSKWRSHQTKVDEAPEHSLTTHEIEDKLYALIYRPRLSIIETFQFDNFVKRLKIKRNKFVFEGILCLWKLLNPFHLTGISKQVYIKFYQFIHFSILSINTPAEDYENIVKIDVEIDFKNSDVQGFNDFYDSLFETIDSHTKSMLVSEYCRILKKLHSEVKNSSWIKCLDLHNRLYSEGFKSNYPNWALPFLRNKSIESPANLVRTNLVTPSIPAKQATKTEKQKNDLLKSKFEKMNTTWEEQKKIYEWKGNRHKSLVSTKTPTIRFRKMKPLSFNKNDAINPVAKKQKNFRDRKIIEEVVKDRKEKYPDSHQRVLHTPLNFIWDL